MDDEQKSALVWLIVLITIMGSAAVFLFALPQPGKTGTERTTRVTKSRPTTAITTTQTTTETIAKTEKTTVVQASFPLNINTATKEELMQIRGIGETYASRIITYREENGPFQSVDDLLDINGIGEKRLEAWREYLVCE